MKTTSVGVKTYYSEEKQVVKLCIFAETDQSGKVFCNIQGQTPTTQSMIDYSYSQETALEKFVELATKMLQEQTEKLSSK